MVTGRLLVLALIYFVQPSQNVQKASIQGSVTGTGTGMPLRGARISLIKITAENGGTETSLSSITTDSSGRFLFTGVDAGDYRLSAERDGYTRQHYGQKKLGGSGAILSIRAGQRLTTDFQTFRRRCLNRCLQYIFLVCLARRLPLP